jgi:S-DNA-T family DNA segregation ATPase FtsK/SpoIIIE
MITAMRSGRKERHWAVGLGYTVGRTARWMWDRRIEIALFMAALIVYALSTQLPIWSVAPIWALAVAAIALDVRRKNRFFTYLNQRLFAAKVRRQLERAAKDAGFPGLQTGKVSATLPGELVEVRVPRGQTVARLGSVKDAIAACMRVSDVRVIPDNSDEADSSQATVSVIRRNPFIAMSEMEWPLLNAEAVDSRQGIPFGLDEYGRVMQVDLLFRNLIMGGAPNAGKSASLRIPIAAAVLDPTAKVWMMDAKTGGAEFIHWTPAAERVILGRDLEGAVEMLAQLEERVEKRGQEIVARGKVAVQPDMEIDYLFIDELPQFMRVFETDTKIEAGWVKSIREHIWRLIAMGRWAGMITVLSAQKPTADIVPSESRDLIDLKFALHCNTRAMSDAILGAGAGEEAPANAADIPSGQAGVGYFVGTDGTQKMRTFFIPPEQALEISSRVARRSMDDELAAL